MSGPQCLLTVWGGVVFGQSYWDDEATYDVGKKVSADCGGGMVVCVGQSYWNDEAAYEVKPEGVAALRDATRELHRLCLEGK
jgi:glutathionylspermidine synthase